MLTREDNDLLTRTGPGTPAGHLLRRYWQPVALGEALAAGAAPLPVRLLGEDLVLFRDGAGRPGLLALHCSHRGADLSYGRVEDGGLRCLYHGWLYDIQGRCLDQPGEPDAGPYRDKILHPAYPCIERAGVVFAYLGPGEAPLLPDYEFLTVPEDQVYATKLFHECNYLQGNEGNIDYLHVSFLHFRKDRDFAGPVERPGILEFSGRGVAPTRETIDAEITEYGLRVCKIRDLGSDQKHLYVGSFILPNFFAFHGGPTMDEGYAVNWHVPVDDRSHWKYTFIFSRKRALDKERLKATRPRTTPDYRPIQNKGNRYLQDRASLRAENYTGVDNTQVQDLCVVEGQGAIQDRTKEHLMPSDVSIVVARKIILQAIRDVEEGRDPPHVIRDPKSNQLSQVFTYSGVVASDTAWKEHIRRLDARKEEKHG